MDFLGAYVKVVYVHKDDTRHVMTFNLIGELGRTHLIGTLPAGQVLKLVAVQNHSACYTVFPHSKLCTIATAM
jgi:hypothetical protein